MMGRYEGGEGQVVDLGAPREVVGTVSESFGAQADGRWVPCTR
jgi:hypothetical protein